jgi:hypothetical protein
VAAFTGFLYITQNEKSDPTTVAEKYHLDPNVFGEENEVNSGLEDSTVEVFLFEAEKLEQMMRWPHEQKSKREQLLEALNWEADPDEEITIPAPTDGIEQKSSSSNLKTRRS